MLWVWCWFVGWVVVDDNMFCWNFLFECVYYNWCIGWGEGRRWFLIIVYIFVICDLVGWEIEIVFYILI